MALLPPSTPFHGPADTTDLLSTSVGARYRGGKGRAVALFAMPSPLLLFPLPGSRPRHFDNGNYAREFAPLSLDLRSGRDSQICSRPVDSQPCTPLIFSLFSPSVHLCLLHFIRVSVFRVDRGGIEHFIYILSPPASIFFRHAKSRTRGRTSQSVFLAFCRLILSVFYWRASGFYGNCGRVLERRQFNEGRFS